MYLFTISYRNQSSRDPMIRMITKLCVGRQLMLWCLLLIYYKYLLKIRFYYSLFIVFFYVTQNLMCFTKASPFSFYHNKFQTNDTTRVAIIWNLFTRNALPLWEVNEHFFVVYIFQHNLIGHDDTINLSPISSRYSVA